MQAIILVGGFGTRLRSLVADVPKPMAPIGDKPFLAFLLAYLSTQGISDVVLSVGYQHDVIKNYFNNNYSNLNIRYAIEDKALGTGGAVKKSMEYIESDHVFILNGDTFLKTDYRALLKQQQQTNNNFILTLKQVADVGRYGAVNVENNRVIGFFEKGKTGPGLINTGVYLCSKDFFNSFELPETFSLETDFLYQKTDMIKAGAHIVDDYFIDIGIPEDYLRAQQELFR